MAFFTFICKYLWESFRVGYYKNKFEVEARKAESDKQGIKIKVICFFTVKNS